MTQTQNKKIDKEIMIGLVCSGTFSGRALARA